MNADRAAGVLARILVMACLTLAPCGCENTITGVQPRPTPTQPPHTPTQPLPTPTQPLPTPTQPPHTPTPRPSNIAGAWTGTYTRNNNQSCASPFVVGAAFQQGGALVTATFSHRSSSVNWCLIPYSFSGHLNGDFLIGTTTARYGYYGEYSVTADAIGHVRSGEERLSISLSGSNHYEAQMELHR